MGSDQKFKLTYGTMFSPPEEFHSSFESNLADLRKTFGQEYSMIIDGKEVFADEKFENRSPINTDQVIGLFQKGDINNDRGTQLLYWCSHVSRGWKKPDGKHWRCCRNS